MRGVTVPMLLRTILPLVVFVSIASAQEKTDSAAYLLRKGSANYDSVPIQRAMTFAGSMPSDRRYLFIATCCYRLQTFAWRAGNRKVAARYGERALIVLDSAESSHADPYSVYTIRTYVSQLMAGLGITYGPKYGPLIGKYFKIMKSLNPNGFDTRFIESINLLEMPSFIGGNPAKALPLLAALYREYPDSVAVGISLARGMVKTGNKAEAIAVLDGIIKARPGNVLARKEREGLR